MKGHKKNITVILDDDPTGTQTVHGISVLTTWDLHLLIDQFNSDEKSFFVLTNSRAFPQDIAYNLMIEVCNNLEEAAAFTNKSFNIILRGDSTLRGHFPTEPNAVEKVLGEYDRWIVCPFFEEGGRITLDDIHYIKEGDKLIPVAESPFAKDASFGYSNSDLKKWIEEKTNGSIKEYEIGSLKSQNIASEGESYVLNMLRKPTKTWVVNATTMAEMRIFASACRQLEEEGLTLLYRTAASFVQAYLQIDKKPLLSLQEITDPIRSTGSKNGGLVVAGSYVPKTTEQLRYLLDVPGIHSIELTTDVLLGKTEIDLDHTIETINKKISSGETVVIYTSRTLIKDDDAVKNLVIGNHISGILVKIVRNISVRPDFLIAKGGITSSDIASKGLNVKKARILGQALPGVPVWSLGNESRFPGLPYIVFAGNVGEPKTLEILVTRLLEVGAERDEVL